MHKTIFSAFLPTLTLCATLSAQAADKPDLTISSIGVLGGAKMAPCTNRLRVAIRNNSNKGYGGTIKLSLAGNFQPETGFVYHETFDITGGIGPNTTRAASFANVPLAANGPGIFATVDPANTITETNENNNTRTYQPSPSLKPCVKVRVSNDGGFEGNKFVFRVNASPAPSGYTVKVGYASKNGTAIGGPGCNGSADFIHRKGTLHFQSGQSQQTVAIQTCKDLAAKEGKETFSIHLSVSANAILTDGEGIGTISVPQ